MVLKSWYPFWGGCLCEQEPNEGRLWDPQVAWGTLAFGTGCRAGQRELTEGKREALASTFSRPLCLRRSSSLAEVARAPLSPHLTRELRGSISRGELGGSMSGGSSTFTGSLAAGLPLRAATTPGALSLPQGSLQEHEGVRCGPGWERRGDQYTHGSRRPCRAPSRPWVPGGVLLAHYPSSTASSRAGILAPTVTVAHPAGSKLSAHRGGLSPRAVAPGTALQ